MRRVAQGQEFRSNVHRGGRTEVVQLDKQYERTAIRSAQILGLRVAGVDMLEGADGPQVMEVNSSPGLEGIEAASGVDVAGAVIDYTAAQVMFPELDVRQRLTVSQGYGVAEILIAADSDLVGRTLAEARLRDRDIVVLNLEREGEVISNPHGERTLQGGDHLLCFGLLSAMRDLVPVKERRRKRKAARAAAAAGSES
jgi:ribosomal protein S6--L-glutamate ligase